MNRKLRSLIAACLLFATAGAALAHVVETPHWRNYGASAGATERCYGDKGGAQ